MNIYDFDNTIYKGDSCKDLVLYGLKKHPFLTIKSLIKARKLNSEYKKGLIEYEIVKENLLSFVFKIDNYDNFIEDFVNDHMENIKPWYKKYQTDDDILVTASFDLWINKFASRLNIKHVIATNVDKNGHIIGKNCKSEEKVKRIKELFPKAKFITSYSDSSADIPILELSKDAYVVEGNTLIPYKKGYDFKNHR